MKLPRLEPLFLGLLLLGLAIFIGFTFMDRGTGLTEQQRGYSPDLNELRARFNQDRGKVRLVLLLSPT